jgi:hypothetical protein
LRYKEISFDITPDRNFLSEKLIVPKMLLFDWLKKYQFSDGLLGLVGRVIWQALLAAMITMHENSMPFLHAPH